MQIMMQLFLKRRETVVFHPKVLLHVNFYRIMQKISISSLWSNYNTNGILQSKLEIIIPNLVETEFM